MKDRLRGIGRGIVGPPATPDGAPLFWFVTLIVGALVAIGLVMVLSASSVMSIKAHGSAWYFFDRQLVFGVFGVLAFLLAARIDYHVWQRIAVPLLFFAVASLALVLVPGIGRVANGARRWIGVNSTIGFQPSEIAKLVLLVFAAELLARRAAHVEDVQRCVAPILIVTVTMCAFIVLEPDLDAAMEVALIAFAILFVSGVRMKHIGAIAGGAVATVGVLAVAAPYRLGRVLTFLDPSRDPTTKSYQITQSLIAIGNGGLTGVGLGAGRAKWQFLPAAHTDFIFAVIAEETGFIGALLVIGLFVAFAYAGARVALRARDRFGMLLAAGVTAWVAGQAALNLAMVVGLVPVSGTPLPFISAGGSSLVILMAAAGLLANVARQCAAPALVRSARHPSLAARAANDSAGLRPSGARPGFARPAVVPARRHAPRPRTEPMTP